jgi:predicted transcriptional regulator
MGAFTVRISDETTARLDALAGELDRSRAYLAAKAIEEYVAREAWQLAEIKAGLAEAEAGDFASEAEMNAMIGKHVEKASG